MNRVMRCAGVALLLATARPACAQSGTILRGSITSADNGEPLGFSIVTLTPTAGRRFTDATGAFAFQVEPGTYLLSVRHVGYAPLDTQVVVGAEGATVALTIRHLAIDLPPVTIIGRVQCTRPGPPDPAAAPALAAVFEQLQENARRFALLADSFPFEYRLEQTLQRVNGRGDTLRAEIDTIRLASRSERPYEPGRVVTPGWGPWRSPLVVRTASLEEFGNPTFVKHHCFRLVGRDTIEAETLVRIDFDPATSLGWADMAGSAYLDSTTYQLRFTESFLTRPELSQLSDVATMVARTRFRDVGRGIPVQDYLRAVTTFRSGGRRRLIETQRTVEVRFRNN